MSLAYLLFILLLYSCFYTYSYNFYYLTSLHSYCMSIFSVICSMSLAYLPFLATANAIINCRNGVMQLTFGNMALELNIFHLNYNPNLLETENHITDEVVSIDQCVGKQGTQEIQKVTNNGDEEKLVLPSTPTASQLLNPTAITEEQFNIWPPNIMEPAQATAWVEEIILLDPP